MLVVFSVDSIILDEATTFHLTLKCWYMNDTISKQSTWNLRLVIFFKSLLVSDIKILQTYFDMSIVALPWMFPLMKAVNQNYVVMAYGLIIALRDVLIANNYI